MSNETHPDVQWIELKLPVYTGEVDDRTPDYLDADMCDFLSPDEREAVNRVHLGHASVHGNPARLLAANGVAARALFATIAQECERQSSESSYSRSVV